MERSENTYRKESERSASSSDDLKKVISQLKVVVARGELFDEMTKTQGWNLVKKLFSGEMDECVKVRINFENHSDRDIILALDREKFLDALLNRVDEFVKNKDNNKNLLLQKEKELEALGGNVNSSQG